jgi:hypothetical protein
MQARQRAGRRAGRVGFTPAASGRAPPPLPEQQGPAPCASAAPAATTASTCVNSQHTISSKPCSIAVSANLMCSLDLLFNGVCRCHKLCACSIWRVSRHNKGHLLCSATATSSIHQRLIATGSHHLAGQPLLILPCLEPSLNAALLLLLPLRM